MKLHWDVQLLTEQYLQENYSVMFKNFKDDKSIEEFLTKVYYGYIYISILVAAVVEGAKDAVDIVAMSMNKEIEYILLYVGIVTMILAIPLSLKLHKFSFYQKRFIVEDICMAYESYFKMSLLRYFILFFAALMNIFTYIIYDNNSSGICLIIIGIAFFFCIPTDIKVRREMNRTQEDNEQANNEMKKL